MIILIYVAKNIFNKLILKKKIEVQLSALSGLNNNNENNNYIRNNNNINNQNNKNGNKNYNDNNDFNYLNEPLI